MSFDVAIIGAGMAGLTCAQQLHQAGYTVVVIEKSRGVGGRMATRRLQQTWADHGARYIQPQAADFQALIHWLVDRAVMQVWPHQIYQLGPAGQLRPVVDPTSGYASPSGITAIAKFLATGLTLHLGQRLVHLQASAIGWELQCTANSPEAPDPTPIVAQALVLAVPAPQAGPLLATAGDADLLHQVESVEFAPCLSAMAVYPAAQQTKVLELGWQGIICPHDPILSWMGWDSSKQVHPHNPVLVVQSTAPFAQQHLETVDLLPVGQQLLNQMTQRLNPESPENFDWLREPTPLQVQRWRYALATNPLPARSWVKPLYRWFARAIGVAASGWKVHFYRV
jgi:renalase